MTGALQGLEDRLDVATTRLLVPLRTSKTIDPLALVDLHEIADAFGELLASEVAVSKSLVGRLWFVFTAMLTEAEHARTPEPILDAAWDYAERLRAIFGPRF